MTYNRDVCVFSFCKTIPQRNRIKSIDHIQKDENRLKRTEYIIYHIQKSIVLRFKLNEKCPYATLLAFFSMGTKNSKMSVVYKSMHLFLDTL